MAITASTTAAALRRRSEDRDRAALRRVEHLLARVPAAAALLRERFGVAEVWLFGSLATGRPNLHSDVDLAVRGLAPERQFEAAGALAAVLPCSVDLVRLEEAPPSLAERVVSEGRAL